MSSTLIARPKAAIALASPPLITSPAEVADWVKPSRGDAAVRLRNSGLALTVLIVLTQLLPLPSPLRAASVVILSQPVGTGTWVLCVVESLALALLTLNAAQSGYALQYPRATPPPPRTPAKLPSTTPHASPTPRRLFPSPAQTSPQPQRAFNAYAPSPLSTPSRTLTYAPLRGAGSPSPLDTSASSSLSFSLPPTPSPGGAPSAAASPLAAYRGRHAASAGRPLDASFLSQLRQADDDDDEE